MEIRYAITRIETDTGTMHVIYSSDEYPQGMEFHLTLPINTETNTTLSGAELHEFIMFHAPRGQMEATVQQLKAAAAVDFSHIEAMIYRSLPEDGNNSTTSTGMTDQSPIENPTE